MVDIELTNPPFSLLDEAQRQRVRAGLDMTYFSRDEIILDAGQPGEFVFVIHKGEVAELDPSQGEADARIGHYTDGDLFGAISVLNGTSRYRFVAEQESLCYLMPRALFLSLCESGPAFADYFQRRLADKSRLLAERRCDGGVTLAGFMLARVTECMREPLVVSQASTISEAVHTLKDSQADSLLVAQGESLGMVTKTDLLDALVIEGRAQSSPVVEITHLRLVAVGHEQYLFEALIEMTRHKVARVVVMDGERLVGVVELTDVLSFFSSRSYVVSLQVEQAASLAALSEASRRTPELVEALMVQGVRLRFAMGMLAALNARIMHKAWDFVIGAEHRQSGCLMVMGSEGRGEQILKTDQDNALILADATTAEEWPTLGADMARFSEVLMDLGYPRCPGNIMVCNPEWVGTLAQWRRRIRRMVERLDADSLMRLAILLDGCAVAGDASLMGRLRDSLIEETQGNELLLTHFARGVLQFSTPLTMFGSLKKPAHGIDIKKGGIFPIVHGVRTLALERGIRATSTLDRLDALVADGRLEAQIAEDLGEALVFFSELRLRAQLATRDADGRAVDASTRVVVQALSSLERDLLREALHIVKDFKARLSQRYHLEYA